MAHSKQLLLFLTAVCAATARQPPRSEVFAPVPGAYLVEFDDNYDAAQFRMQAEPDYETRMELSYELFKGMSIQMDVETAEENAALLAALPAVKSIWPLRRVAVPQVKGNQTSDDTSPMARRQMRESQGASQTRRQTHANSKRQRVPVENANSTHVMTQIDKLHAEGITGKGIKIAVIDTGIDYLHPALGGCFGEGCLVSFGTDLVGDDYDGLNQPIPDDDPRDTCYGHGTHVAGIIAAQENELGIIGAAPDATLAAYRVFGCPGYSTDDIIIAAFNAAYEDGADIITASIARLGGWAQDPFSIAVSRIVEKGVPCTVAAGNDGQPFDISAVSTGEGVAAVASFENTMSPRELHTSFYTIDDSDSEVAFPYAWGVPEWIDEEERIVWATGYDLNNTNDACEPLPDDTPDLSEFNVLIRRGDCDYTTQALNVADKGGRFMTIYNNQAGADFFFVYDPFDGVAMVTQETGETWIKALEAGSVVKTRMVSRGLSESWWINQPNYWFPGAVSQFSSWGPTFEMDAKPQFGAPGQYILSTWLDGGYWVDSGTSMATPLVAAAYALIAQARGTLDPLEIENLLAANANPQLYGDMIRYEGFVDWLTPPAQQGAGLIQVYDAVHATTLLEPSSLSFNDTDHFKETLAFTLTNTDSDSITYEISHVPTYTLYIITEGGWYEWMAPPDGTFTHAELAFSRSSLTIGSGESTTIEVTATPPDLDPARYPLWSGYIAVNGTDGTSLSLSYQGLTGSLYNATVPSSDGPAWLSNSTGSNNWDSWPVGRNATFTFPSPGTNLENWAMNGGHLPLVNYDTRWGTPYMSADVFPMDSCPSNATRPCADNSLGQIAGFPQRFLGRDWWRWLWGGGLASGEYVPPGKYMIVMKTLRIFGDQSKEEDWWTAETTPINVLYEDSA